EAPVATSMPRGILLALKVEIPPGSTARWIGAKETAHTRGWSNAECLLADDGPQTIEAEIKDATGGSRRERIDLSVEDFDVRRLHVSHPTAAVDPIVVDPEDLFGSTHDAYLRRSIADVIEVAPGRYRTSVGRMVTLRAAVEPEDFAPLLEWRVSRSRGRIEALLGSEVQVAFEE